ncbi:8206_t:CDS:2, partial [Racocetra persica]
NVEPSMSSNVTELKQSNQHSDNDFNKTGGFFTTIKPIKELNKNVENQVQKLSDYRVSRIFYNKYPYIIAVYKIGSKDRWQHYKVIRLGHYPSVSKFTRKKKGIAYQIPDEYEIETDLLGLSVRCKTKYQQTGDVSYTISWINSYGSVVSSSSMISANNAGTKFLKDICNKQNTHVSEVFLFGFDIDCLHKARIKTSTNCKHPYIELESNSQKNKRIALVAKDLNIQIVDLFRNHQFVDSSGGNI